MMTTKEEPGTTGASAWAAPATMRAVTHQSYGDADVLEVTNVPVPTPKAGEVLVRVAAASLNPADKFMMQGSIAPIRLMIGLRRPSAEHRVRGHDLTGAVVAVGEGVARLRVGDEVFGSATGTLAEYACGKEKELVVRPPDVSVQDAAAMPMAALTALHGLRDVAALESGQHVLINGAAGGIGTYAVQIAKIFGAEVTGVCSTRNVDLVRDLGADHVIDYTQTSLTRSEQRYDVVFDNVGNHSLAAMRALLTPAGTLLPNSGEPGPDGGPIARMIKATLHSPFSKQKSRAFHSTPNPGDLGWLAERAAEGALRSVIDSVYPLEQAPEAMRKLASRHARGKVVVEVDV